MLNGRKFAILLLAIGLVWVRADGAVAQRLDMVELDCVIQPSEVAEIGSGVLTGILQELLVERGDVVEAGQVVAIIDSRIEQANLQYAQARVDSTAALEAAEDARDFYTAMYERAQSLFDTEVVSAEARDRAEQEAMLAENRWRVEMDALMLARIEVQRAEVALEMRRLKSPVTGMVTDRQISVGESVGQMPLLTIAQLDPLYVEVVAPASLYGQVEVGMTGTVLPGEPIGGSYPARVVIVDRVFDAASNTFGIRLEVANPDYELPAGLRGKVRLRVGPSSP